MIFFQHLRGLSKGIFHAKMGTTKDRNDMDLSMPGWMKHKLGIKIAGRDINNFRYADDIALMAESKEELKNLLMKVKDEGEKASLKLNI